MLFSSKVEHFFLANIGIFGSSCSSGSSFVGIIVAHLANATDSAPIACLYGELASSLGCHCLCQIGGREWSLPSTSGLACP